MKLKERTGSGRKRREPRENRGKGREFMKVGVFFYFKKISDMQAVSMFFLT